MQDDCLDPSGILPIPIGSSGEEQHMQSITIKQQHNVKPLYTATTKCNSMLHVLKLIVPRM